MRTSVLAAVLLAAATATACGGARRAPVQAAASAAPSYAAPRVAAMSDAEAMAMIERMALTGADWEAKLLALPDDAIRPVAVAILRAGKYECTAIIEEEVGCGDTERSFAPLAAGATMADGCLRRQLALWALDQLEPGDVPAVADALAAILALPEPEAELATAAFGVVPAGDDELRLRLIEVAAANHRGDLADEQLAKLAPAGAARALVDLGREAALDHLGDRAPIGVLRAALDGGLSSARALEVIERLEPAHLRDADVAATVRKVAATADCEVAARAIALLAAAGDVDALPGAHPFASDADALRGLCVAGHLGGAELGNVVARLTSGDVELISIARSYWVDPEDGDPDPDGDGDPYTTTTRDLLAAEAVAAGTLADWIPTTCADGTCYVGGDVVALSFGARADGTPTLDTITLEHHQDEGCGC